MENVPPSTVFNVTTKSKKVQFHGTCKLRLFPMHTEEDCKNAWYQPSDYRKFRRHTSLLVRTIFAKSTKKEHNLKAPSKVTEEEKLCWTGLDIFQEKRYDVRKQRRQLVRNIVMANQNCQSSDEIAHICWEEVSEESEKDAQFFANVVAHQVTQELAAALIISNIISNTAKTIQAETEQRRPRVRMLFSSSSVSSSLIRSSGQTGQRRLLTSTME